MKKGTLWLLLIVLMGSLLSGCNAQATPEPEKDVLEDDGVGEDTENLAEDSEKHSIIYFCLNLGDFSFNDSGWNGVQEVAEKYGWSANVIELGSDQSTYKNAFVDAVDSGEYDIVVTQSNYGLADLAVTYAKEYPEIKFVAFDMGITDETYPENFFGIAYLQNEGSYLAGALAGKLTKTNKVGIYLFGDVPVGNDFATGYIAGVREANEDAEVFTTYSVGRGDAAKLQEIAAVMFDNGADVIYGVSGGSFLGLAKEATSRGGMDKGLYTIGVDTDMWTIFSKGENAEFADVIITSMLKNVGYSVVYALTLDQEGTLPWGTVEPMGIAEGAVGLADNSHYRENTPPEILAYIDQLQAEVLSGEKEVPSYFDFADYAEFVEWRDK